MEKLAVLKNQLIDQAIELTGIINQSIYFSQSEKPELIKTALKNLRDHIELIMQSESLVYNERPTSEHPSSPNWNQV